MSQNRYCLHSEDDDFLEATAEVCDFKAFSSAWWSNCTPGCVLLRSPADDRSIFSFDMSMEILSSLSFDGGLG